jgi:RNA polymerase sigma factor for flagellar operon FliA
MTDNNAVPEGQSVDMPNYLSRELYVSSKNNYHVTDEEKRIADEHLYVIEAISAVLFSKKKMPPTVDYNDLISVGFSGLLKAIRGYDKSKNVLFKTYASIRIRGEMLDFIRKEWKSKAAHQHQTMMNGLKERVAHVFQMQFDGSEAPSSYNVLSQLTTSYVLSLDAVMDSGGSDQVIDGANSFENTVNTADEYRCLNNVVKALGPNEQQFLDMFYWQGLSQKEISDQLQISPATVSRMHRRIIDLLKEKMSAESTNK